LTQPTRYTLGKTERLKSRKLIGQLFEQGKSFNIFPFKVLYLITAVTMATPNNYLQAGFSAPTKTFKKAVDRNRIKRLTKEAYRLQKHLLSEQLSTTHQQLFLFFIYTGKEIPDQPLVMEKVNAALKKLSETIGKTSAQ
jgi:ribonuclease P protein component